MHWKVSFEQHPLEKFKEKIHEANIFDLIYEPYELHTDVRKRNQIQLLKAVVFELKADFNNEFIELEQGKEDQCFLIKEKNE